MSGGDPHLPDFLKDALDLALAQGKLQDCIGPALTPVCFPARQTIRFRRDSVEKVENAARAKSSQKFAGGRFLLRMPSSCEEEDRRKVLFKSMRSTVFDEVNRISSS